MEKIVAKDQVTLPVLYLAKLSFLSYKLINDCLLKLTKKHFLTYKLNHSLQTFALNVKYVMLVAQQKVFTFIDKLYTLYNIVTYVIF